MKKNIFLSLLITLVVGFTACNNVDEPQKPDNSVKPPYSETFATAIGKFTEQSVTGTQKWTIDSRGYMKMTGHVSQTEKYANEDWLISPKIDLTGVSAAKMTFDYNASFFKDLATEATVWVSENYIEGLPATATWQQLNVKLKSVGSWDIIPSDEISLTAYKGKKINVAFKYTSTATDAGTWEIKNFMIQEGEAVVDPIVPGGGGTKDSPYSVNQIIEFNPQSTTEAVQTAVWVKGYIVGYYNSTPNPAIVENQAPFTEDFNIMLADNANETDKSKMVSVQLPAGNVRAALGLKTNPTVINRPVMVYGDIMKYNTFPGVKNTSAYWFTDTNTGIDPPTTGTGGAIDLTSDTTTPVISINEDFGTVANNADISLTGWKVFKVLGDRNWQGKIFTPSGGGTVEKYAQASAHNGASPDYEYWLVTPPINVGGLASKTLEFKTAKAYWTATSSLKVFVLKNEGGKTTQTEITSASIVKETDADHTFVPSGTINLSTYTGTIYIGYQYVAKGGASNSTTFRVDDVVVK